MRLAPLAALLLLAGTGLASAGETDIPMQQKNAATYYVPVQLGDSFSGEFLVDTGSSHMAIRESTLRALQEKGHARFVKNLAGRMADGSRKIVPVYRIDKVRIGKHCLLEGVEAAIFPDGARPILGLSALRQAAPVRLSMDPPTLRLGQCGKRAANRSSPDSLAKAGLPE